MATHTTLTSLFSAIADAIRYKKGEPSSVKYVADNFDTAIRSIQTEKPEEVFDVTPTTRNQTILPTEGSVFSMGMVRAMPTGSATTPATTIQQSQPSISVNANGLITTSVAQKTTSITPTVVAGYVASGTAGTVTMSVNNNSLQLDTQAATTITPGTSAKTAVASGKYTTGIVSVAGDTNLIASNIKNGTTIFGVTGTMKGGSYTETQNEWGGLTATIVTGA